MTKFLSLAVAAVAVIFAADFIVRRTASGITDSIDSINEGTPFEDTGPLGTLGNVTDVVVGVPVRAFGGTSRPLSDLGSAIGLFGSKVFNFFAEGEFK